MQTFIKHSCQDIRKFQQERNTGINKEQNKNVHIMKTEIIK